MCLEGGGHYLRAQRIAAANLRRMSSSATSSLLRSFSIHPFVLHQRRTKKKTQRWHGGYHMCSSSTEALTPTSPSSATHADTILIARFVNIPRRNHSRKIPKCSGVISA